MFRIIRQKRILRWRILPLLLTFLFSISPSLAQDTYNQIDDLGNVSQRSDNNNFNKHNNDTTRNKEIPKGIRVWTVDRTFGDIIPAEPDTVHHLFMNTTFNNGMYGEYNHTGSNYTARQSRIFINRPDADYFTFTQPYSFVEKQPDEFLFMLKDWRVIVTLVAMLFVMWAANFILKYKKKPKKNKKGKKAPAPAPKPEEKKETEEKKDEGEAE